MTVPSPRRTLLSLRGHGKRYAAWVLRDGDLNVYPDELPALIGANGVGKSTRVRIASGLAQSDAGLMTFSGQRAVSNGKHLVIAGDQY